VFCLFWPHTGWNQRQVTSQKGNANTLHNKQAGCTKNKLHNKQAAQQTSCTTNKLQNKQAAQQTSCTTNKLQNKQGCRRPAGTTGAATRDVRVDTSNTFELGREGVMPSGEQGKGSDVNPIGGNEVTSDRLGETK
jgi:hypothetical protein